MTPSRKSYSYLLTAIVLAALFALVLPAGATSYIWLQSAGGNWSTPANWNPNSPAGGPTAADTALFSITNTTTSSSTVNNTVDAGFAGTLTALTYNSTNVGAFHVTQIPTGKTLSVTGKITVGQQNGIQLITQAYLTGGGTLATGTTNLVIESYGTASGANSSGNLNLLGLSNFVYTNAVGTLSIGDTTTPTSTFTRAGGNFTLAGVSNFITISNINLGTCSAAQAGPLDTLVFGSGTNILNVANFNIANNKNPANVTVAATSGGIRLRGVSGTDASRANITIGNRNVASSTGATTGNMLLLGSPVDIKANILTIGEAPNAGGAPSGAAGLSGNGSLLFDTGTVDATTVTMAFNTSANGGGGIANATGVLTVGPNATLRVGTGGLSLASQLSSGPATGNLNISNGVVICNGNITMGTNVGTGNVNFLNGGKLVMGAGDIVGTPAFPVTGFNLIENTTLEFVSPSLTATNITANTLTWPANDSQLTIAIDFLPADLSSGTVFTLFAFNGMANGTFTAPILKLPVGVTGNLSLSGNTILLTITGGVGPGIGGVNQLINPGFELTPAKTGWTTSGTTPLITVGSATYPNPAGPCHDASAQLVISNTGTNVANISGSNIPAGSTNFWSQSVATSPGVTFAAGAYTYVSHEDIMAGRNSFYYELDFLDGSGNLLSSYESYVVTNLSCGTTTPFPLDVWTFLATTNVMQVSGGVNTGTILSNISSGILFAPPSAASARLRAIFVQHNATDGGSVYVDDANLGFVSSPTPPTVSAITPNLITLCTNTTLSCTATSTVTTIAGVKIITTTNILGGLTSVTTTNTPSVTGLGTSGVSITYALNTNTVYSSVIVQVTDLNGVVATSTATFDTIVPTLVVEASDFNFTSNGVSGVFIDTTPDGGAFLYLNQVGTPGIDEKATRTSTKAYYRPSDAVVLQGASPGSGTPPSSTEQKFITALATNDTTDIELEVGFNTPGDWLNYSRTFGPGGSAPTGTYNVWVYLATTASGVQASFSEVTNDPTMTGQLTNFLGNFGTASFTDNGFNNYVYVPLVDQFGNPVAITVTNAGVHTFKSTVVGNPNIGFYLFVPVAPVFTPALLHISPNGSVPGQESNQLSFTVGPENGAPIATSGIDLVLNGVDVSSGLSFISAGGGAWTVNFPLTSNQTYTATINVTNTSGLFSTYTINFDTFDLNNFQWEAVNYDFTTNGPDGQVSDNFIDNAIPTADTLAPGGSGYLATNSYYGTPTGDSSATALQGVDVNYAAASGITHIYRSDSVGTELATDFLRPKFIAAQTNFPSSTIGEFDLGWFNTGDWVNYTRTYPTGVYNVWARLAGGAGAFAGTTLSVVTNGVGTSVQYSNVLGTFSDPNPAGWEVWHWIPLVDGSGNKVAVQFGGVSTLKLTSGNNLNALFFMLTPAVVQAAPFSITDSLNGTNVLISFPTQTGHNYTVWQSGSITGTFTSIVGPIPGNGSINIVTQAVSGARSFYRVSAQ